MGVLERERERVKVKRERTADEWKPETSDIAVGLSGKQVPFLQRSLSLPATLDCLLLLPLVFE